MKIQSIQGQNFQAKRYLSKDGMQNLHSLLDKMNQESVYPNKDNFFEAMILDKVIIGKDSKIADFRWFTQGRKNVGTMHGESVIGVNKKTAFFVNNETGEVKKMKKPLFSKWTTILRDGENIVKEANENFDNNNIVKKCYNDTGDNNETNQSTTDGNDLSHSIDCYSMYLLSMLSDK